MYLEAQKLRDQIKIRLPEHAIVPEHTEDSHHYRVNIFEGSPLFDSVTTKTAIIEKLYLKQWGINLAIDYIRRNIDDVINENTRLQTLSEASKQSDYVLEDAGNIGGRAHKIIEAYINEWIELGIRPQSIIPFIPTTETDSRVLSAIKACEKFCTEHYIVPIHSEILVASSKLKVGGTMDFLCYYGTVKKGGKIAGCPHDFQYKGTSAFHQECIICGEQIDYELAIIDWKTSNSIKGKVEYALQVAAYRGCIKELLGVTAKQLLVVRLDKSSGLYEAGYVPEPEKMYKAYEHLSIGYDIINEPTEHLKVIKKEPKVLVMDI